MTDPHLNLHTTSQLLKRTNSTFTSNLFTFIFLSLLLLSFRSTVENGTHIVTAFIDGDPSLKALLSRLDIAGKNLRSPESLSPSAAVHRRRRRPFLHLTRVGTLDDDFFSGDDDGDRTLFGPRRKSPINGSFITLSNFDKRLGFSEFIEDNGIRVSEIVRSGFSFNVGSLSLDGDGYGDDEGNKTIVFENREEGGGGGDRVVDFQFFVKGLELGRRDTAALFFLVSFLSAAYGWVILGFLVTYSWVERRYKS